MRITPVETLSCQTIRPVNGERLTRKAIEQYQGEELCRVTGYCRERSPWFRRKFDDAGIGIINGLQDLSTLPLTCEEELRTCSSEMVCVGQDEIARIITLHSSGTTGVPKRLFFTDEDLERTLNFFHQGMQTLVDPAQKAAVLLPGTTPDSTGYLLAQALERMAVSSDIPGLVDNAQDFASTLAALQPDVLVGFPVQLLAIAQTAAALAIPLGNIRSVLLCSDYIPESLSTRLGQLLSCQVFTHYGTVETGLGGGVDCAAHRGCHLREADLLFEIIDPKTTLPLAVGDWGEIVFTTLTRAGMPLIRYRTGDYGRLLPGPCPCGSHIRRLDRVRGRINQFRTLQNGQQLAMSTLDEQLFAVPGLLDFRAMLTMENKRDKLFLHLIAIPGSEEEVLRQVTRAMTHHPFWKELLFSLTIDTTSPIHKNKRILEYKKGGK